MLLAHCCASLECGTLEGGLVLPAGRTLNLYRARLRDDSSSELEGMWKETVFGCCGVLFCPIAADVRSACSWCVCGCVSTHYLTGDGRSA
jgi:hypothetical protein